MQAKGGPHTGNGAGTGAVMPCLPGPRRPPPVSIWLHAVVRVDLAGPVWEARHQDGLAVLRALERWLAGNHRPKSLFDAFGRPRGEVVSVFFKDTESEAAHAFRALCLALGLTGRMHLSRLVHRRGERTWPP